MNNYQNQSSVEDELERLRVESNAALARHEAEQSVMVPQVEYALMGKWLVGRVDGCTCGAGATGYGHASGCGWEPLIAVEQIEHLSLQRTAVLDYCATVAAEAAQPPYVPPPLWVVKVRELLGVTP